MTTIKRVLTPEILDSLPADDPEAVRSRSDLRRINAFMGNKRWLERKIREIVRETSDGVQVIEVGAGDGSFLKRIAHQERANLLGIDLVEKPEALPSELKWLQVDILKLDSLPFDEGRVGIVVCNLILHHFEAWQLKKLGKLLEGADHILIVEPYRSWLPYLMGYLAFPFVNRVTRHDMMVSIQAGFKKSELPEFFSGKSCASECVNLRGGVRVHLI